MTLRTSIRRLCDEYPNFVKYPVCTNDSSLFEDFLEANPILKALDSSNIGVFESTLKDLKEKEEKEFSKVKNRSWVKNESLDASILSSF